LSLSYPSVIGERTEEGNEKRAQVLSVERLEAFFSEGIPDTGGEFSVQAIRCGRGERRKEKRNGGHPRTKHEGVRGKRSGKSVAGGHPNSLNGDAVKSAF